MIKAVLVGLEDILLHGADGGFTATLEGCAAEARSGKGAAERLSAAIAFAQESMLDGRDMMTANAAVLTELIASRLELSRDEANVKLREHFAAVGRLLEAKVRPDPCASPLIGALLERNLAVALACDPIYPEETVRQWLGWAGLTPFRDDLAFVAHSGNTRSLKSDPAYFAELVARIGVEPDETLLIGNSMERDIVPARSAGLQSWRVTPARPLAMFYKQLQMETWQDGHLPRPLAIQMPRHQYRGNIAALYGLLSEVRPNQWGQKPDPDEWSILQILCHLLQAEAEVHRRRLEMILQEDSPFVRAPAPPGPDLPPCSEDGYAIMREFRDERHQTMKLLAGLTEEDWQREARHSIFGLTNLLEMAHFTAQHDRLHINQLCQTLGKCSETS